MVSVSVSALDSTSHVYMCWKFLEPARCKHHNHPSIMPLSPTTRYSVYINLCQSLLPSRNCKTAILRATQTLFLPWPSALGFSFVLLFFQCPVYWSTVRSSIWGWSQQLNIVVVEWTSGFQFGHFCAHNKIVYIIIIFEEATYTQYCQWAFWVLDSILLCLCKTGWSPAVNHGASVRTQNPKARQVRPPNQFSCLSMWTHQWYQRPPCI